MKRDVVDANDGNGTTEVVEPEQGDVIGRTGGKAGGATNIHGREEGLRNGAIAHNCQITAHIEAVENSAGDDREIQVSVKGPTNGEVIHIIERDVIGANDIDGADEIVGLCQEDVVAGSSVQGCGAVNDDGSGVTDVAGTGAGGREIAAHGEQTEGRRAARGCR